MRKIVEYTVVAQGDVRALSNYVNARIEAGWQPYGSMTSVTEAGNFLHCQPMVKYFPSV